MKNKLSIILSTILLLCFINPSYSNAMQSVDIKEINEVGNMKIHDISELSTINIKDTYSYEEYLLEKLKLGLISQNEYDINKNNIQLMARFGSSVRYAKFRMKTYEINNSLGSNYKLQPIFMVGLEYLKNSVSPTRIVELTDPYIYTGGGKECLFSGKIFFRLESGNSFYYDVYGDVYKTGKLNWSAGASVGIGKSASANFTISNGSGYIKNVSFDGRYYSSGMMK